MALASLARRQFQIWRDFRRCFSTKQSQRQPEPHAACVDVKVPESHYFRPESLPGFDLLAKQHNLRTYKDFYKFSLENNELFWGILGQHYLQWHEPFHSVVEGDFAKGDISWFKGGALNISENCLDRHAHSDPERVALIWERDEPGSQENMTYSELLKLTCRLANVLKNAEVKKGDRVCIYMPTSPFCVAAMLACARIGAVHNAVFAGFSAESLCDRIMDSEAKVVVTTDEMVRGGKKIPLKKIVDEAIKGCSSVKHVLVQQRNRDTRLGSLDVPLLDALSHSDSVCAPEKMESEDPLFLLYTSGSTGKPKGILHTQAGYLLYAAVTHRVCFNYTPGDVFGCLADVGWVTGHSYIVYGPLANGGTTVLFESTPVYPDAGRYWETVQRLKINQLYVAPTALRLLYKQGDKLVKKYDRSSLKTLGVVGEPINHEAWEWYYDVVGDRRCPVVDTYWQTETGGICISPLPADKNDPIYPTLAMRPFFGIEPRVKSSEALVDHGADKAGKLCFARPWPGIARGVWGDQKRFNVTYFAEYKMYFTGDGCIETPEEYYRITGRTDDVINISGHRVGTAEVEDALDSHKTVSEAAVISIPHGTKGEGLAAFVVLMEENVDQDPKQIVKELKQLVKLKIASYAIPEEIIVVPTLPRTRSGKIMRRFLKKIATGETDKFGDTSTLSEPESLKIITDIWLKSAGERKKSD